MELSEPRPGTEIPGIRLLRTKLFVPQPHADLVPRTRLLRRLDQGQDCALALVVAPAGFGKTTLIGEWIAASQARASFGWVSLDPGDNDPVRFWTYLVAALRSAWGRSLGEPALQLLASPQPPPMEAILTDLINEIAVEPATCNLVLDDYHVIENQEIHRALDFLLGNLPANLHILIASRQAPPLALPLLRGRGRLLELGPQDLRFTEEEAALFLNRLMGLGLSPEQVRALEARTEGWAAGLQLAALSMRGTKDVDRFVRAFSGEHRYVFDYLAQEVLARQEPPLRAFLLQSAILDRMCAGLCDAVLPGTSSKATLERLDAANVFIVPLDHERQWYRYHQLFAGFLRAKLAEQYDGQAIAVLHRRASAWYQERGFLDEALEHALAAGEYDAAARLMRQLAPEMFRRSSLHTVLEWFRMLPGSYLATHPDLAMCRAWALLATGQRDEADRQLEAIEAGTGVTTEALSSPATAEALAPATRAALVEVAALRSNIAAHRFDMPGALKLAEMALQNLSQDEAVYLYNPPRFLRPAILFTLSLGRELAGQTEAASASFAEAARLADDNWHIYMTALGHLAQAQALQGQLNEAARTCRKALDTARSQRSRPTPMAGVAHAELGHLLYEWNDLAAAETELRAAIEISRPWRYWEALVPAHLGLARVYRAGGNWTAAEAELDGLALFCERLRMPALLPSVAAARARLQYERGNLAAAGAWAAAHDLSTDEIPYLREGETLALGRVLLGVGELATAGRLLDRLLAAAEAGGRHGRTIEILVLKALLAHATGHPSEALTTLGRALALGEPQGYVRTFVDEGAVMAALLAIVRERDLPPASQAYARRLLAACEPIPSHDGQPRPAPAVEQLSAREIEVLTLLAQGLSNQEIADRLVVTVNTVKTHLKTIYGKLGASTRTQALAQARQLRLI